MQLSLGRCPKHIDDENGECGGIKFFNDRLTRFLGEFPARFVDLFNHILNGFVLIKAGRKFQYHHGIAIGGYTVHLLKAIEGFKFGLHGTNKKALRILGRDAGQNNAHINNGNWNIRFCIKGQFTQA